MASKRLKRSRLDDCPTFLFCDDFGDQMDCGRSLVTHTRGRGGGAPGVGIIVRVGAERVILR